MQINHPGATSSSSSGSASSASNSDGLQELKAYMSAERAKDSPTPWIECQYTDDSGEPQKVLCKATDQGNIWSARYHHPERYTTSRHACVIFITSETLKAKWDADKASSFSGEDAADRAFMAGLNRIYYNAIHGTDQKQSSHSPPLKPLSATYARYTVHYPSVSRLRDLQRTPTIREIRTPDDSLPHVLFKPVHVSNGVDIELILAQQRAARQEHKRLLKQQQKQQATCDKITTAAVAAAAAAATSSSSSKKSRFVHADDVLRKRQQSKRELWVCLSSQLQECVFQYLDDAKDVFVLPRVCRAWRDAFARLPPSMVSKQRNRVWLDIHLMERSDDAEEVYLRIRGKFIDYYYERASEALAYTVKHDVYRESSELTFKHNKGVYYAYHPCGFVRAIHSLAPEPTAGNTDKPYHSLYLPSGAVARVYGAQVLDRIELTKHLFPNPPKITTRQAEFDSAIALQYPLLPITADGVSITTACLQQWKAYYNIPEHYTQVWWCS